MLYNTAAKFGYFIDINYFSGYIYFYSFLIDNMNEKKTTKKPWSKPEIYLLGSNDVINAKGVFNNHEVHNNKQSKITAGPGLTTPAPATLYNSVHS